MSDDDKIIQLKPDAEKERKASEKKWGKKVVGAGFCIVPSLIFKAQARLGINATQLAILMHLADFWWDVGRKPYPGKKLLAERLRLSPRQIQRHMADLEEMGLVRRIQRTAKHKGKLTNEYDLSGLVKRLKAIEPEFREVEDKVKSERRAVTRPGLKKRGTKNT